MDLSKCISSTEGSLYKHPLPPHHCPSTSFQKDILSFSPTLSIEGKMAHLLLPTYTWLDFSFTFWLGHSFYPEFPACSSLPMRTHHFLLTWVALFALRKHFSINPLPSVHHPMSSQNIIVLCHFILVDTLLVIASFKLCCCHCICLYLIYIPLFSHVPLPFLFQRVF